MGQAEWADLYVSCAGTAAPAGSEPSLSTSIHYFDVASYSNMQLKKGAGMGYGFETPGLTSIHQFSHSPDSFRHNHAPRGSEETSTRAEKRDNTVTHAATSKVFCLPEVLERILRHLPMRNLFTHQRVNKIFRTEIEREIVCRKHASSSVADRSRAGDEQSIVETSPAFDGIFGGGPPRPFHIFWCSHSGSPSRCGNFAYRLEQVRFRHGVYELCLVAQALGADQHHNILFLSCGSQMEISLLSTPVSHSIDLYCRVGFENMNMTSMVRAPPTFGTLAHLLRRMEEEKLDPLQAYKIEQWLFDDDLDWGLGPPYHNAFFTRIRAHVQEWADEHGTAVTWDNYGDLHDGTRRLLREQRRWSDIVGMVCAKERGASFSAVMHSSQSNAYSQHVRQQQ